MIATFTRGVAAAALALAAMPAAAETIEIVSGTQRAFQLPSNGGTAGQTFTAVDTQLTRFGFQFTSLNPGFANPDFTFTLYAGEGFGGAVLRTVTFTVPTTITGRTPQWVDFDVTGTTLELRGRYTAALTSTNARYGVAMGPSIDIRTGAELSGDAYAGGRAVFVTEPYGNCARTGNCDLNFRFTGNTPAAAVPEPASWALMTLGIGLAGATARRRRRATISI